MHSKLISRLLLACVASATLCSCSLFGLSSSMPYLTQINQGQTYEEVKRIMKGEPYYRQFTPDGREQWEYHKNPSSDGRFDVVLIEFQDGRVVSLNSFASIEPVMPPAPRPH